MDWLVVFKEPLKEHVVIVNDYDQLRKFYEENKNNIFVGYNNKHYDDFIFKGILSNLNPYKISEWIIAKDKAGWNFPGIDKKYNLISLDLMQDISGAIGIGLKEIESNLGMNIQETEVNFDINRNLTEDEINETIFYCKHDVDATEKLMEVRKDYIVSKLMLINQFELPMSSIGKTNAQLTADVMNPRKKQYDDGLMYYFPDNLKLKNTSILSLYESPLNKKQHLDVTLCGVPHKLAFGGLHGALEKVHIDESDGEILNADVASYYPSLIIKYGFFCRGIRDPKLYEKIYNQRIAWKKAKDPRQAAFKLVLNTFFGAMGSEYNKLYDPLQCNQICITGQLYLIDLIEKLTPYVKLIQSNTDGICFQTKQRAKCEEIIHEWEQRTGMNMEIDNIKQIYQKDVNNYIIEMTNGKIKTKGAYVKNYKHGSYMSNSMTILDDAIVNYLIYKIPVEKTVNECDDAMKFQITTKKGPTFLRVEWMINNEPVITNNVNRVFASKDNSHGKLVKVKQNGRRDTIGGLPEHCLVYNNSVDTFDMNLLDKEWYINEAKRRINEFLGG